MRGDLLEKLGPYAEARTEFERAAVLAKNAREQELLRRGSVSCNSLDDMVQAVASRSVSISADRAAGRCRRLG
jgi:hypothetical protein